MGCDIHCKIFLKLRKGKGYLDSDQINFYDDAFPVLFPGRFYDLFGVFGNTMRSYYPEVNGLEYGFPDFLKNSILKKMLTDVHTGDFGFVYANPFKLRRNLVGYRNRLIDPEKFLDHDSDEYLDFKDGVFTKEQYIKEHKNVADGIQEIIDKLGYFDRMKEESDNEYSRYHNFNRYFDIDETVLLIWFDN